jgi:hypothetical protein
MKNLKYQITLVLVFVLQFAQAQPTFNDDTQDVPVDNWVVPMLAIGIFLVFIFFRKQQRYLVK